MRPTTWLIRPRSRGQIHQVVGVGAGIARSGYSGNRHWPQWHRLERVFAHDRRSERGRRSLRVAGTARSGRNGGGLRGFRSSAGPRGGGEATQCQAGGRPDRSGAIRSRGAGGCEPEPPEHRVGLRHRRGHRSRDGDLHPLHRDGAGGGIDAPLGAGRGGSTSSRARFQHHPERARRPRHQSRRRDHPSRHQAGECDAHPDRCRQGDGLRHRPGGGRNLDEPDPDRRGDRHCALPVPRAGIRRQGGSAQRSLLDGLPAVRTPDGSGALRRRDLDQRRVPARTRGTDSTQPAQS